MTKISTRSMLSGKPTPAVPTVLRMHRHLTTTDFAYRDMLPQMFSRQVKYRMGVKASLPQPQAKAMQSRAGTKPPPP